ncbi:unnamed protein product [Diamesa tonsa]
MQKISSITLVVLCICAISLNKAKATQTRQCEGFRQLGNNEISLSNCEKGVCKLKRKTDANIIMKFIPLRDIKTLTTNVNAKIGGFPFPFVGVDGTSACNNLFLEDGVTKSKCPLKAGVKYIYKNAFPILEVYPKIALIVHWQLTTDKNEAVMCFEIPAKIV